MAKTKRVKRGNAGSATGPTALMGIIEDSFRMGLSTVHKLALTTVTQDGPLEVATLRVLNMMVTKEVPLGRQR